MKKHHLHFNPCVTGSAFVLAAAAAVFGQEKPAPATPPVTNAPTLTATNTAAEPGALDKFFNGTIPAAFAKGKFNLNVRARYEFVNQDGYTDDSHAATIRTRFGFTTAPTYGFQGMIEGENVAAIGPEGNYNAAGSNGKGYKPPVADPPTTELNQAWLSYSYTNRFTVKAGRQQLVLDNARFVGDVGWRQNMQTFDAVGATFKPVKDFSLYYGYLWEVNRVFGDVAGLPAGFTDFSSKSHLINASYTACEYAKVVGYAYLLDLQNAAGPNNSCATYGGFVTGAAPLNDQVKLNYRGEVAWQSDYADSTQNYDALYYDLELGATVKPFAFGAGYEVLGSDNNVGFKTPLATLHAFNGWADAFLTTPNAGLRDLYAYGQVTLPAEMPLRVVYHKFDADSGGGDFGQEVDAVISKKFGQHWNALLKYAYYLGEDAAAGSTIPIAANVDAQKLWAQVEFNF
jgi:hypothetical protein